VDRLDRYRCDVLRFSNDFSVSFDNNQAERDLRMAKLLQKISGCYRTEAGTSNNLAVRYYISTARKEGANVLDALRVCEGIPFMHTAARAQT
jgi:transposase